MTAPVQQKIKTDESGNRMVHCTTVEDLFLPAARNLIGTLARPFLDQMAITPTELIFSARNHSRIDGAGTLLRDITERASALQAKAIGQKTYDRVREVQGLLEQLSTKIRAFEAAEPPIVLKPGEFVSQTAQILRSGPPDVANLRLQRMLLENLAGCKNWLEKIDRLHALAMEAASSPYLPIIDGLLSESIISDMAQDSFFGRRMVLEDRIDDLIDLYKGTYPTRRMGEPHAIALKLQNLLKQLDLPETMAAIETSIVQQLASRNPIASSELMTELRATHAVLGRLRFNDRILGGRRALEFIDKRMGRLLSEEGIADYIRNQGSLAEKVTRLLEIYAVTFGPNNKKVIEGFLQRYFADEDFDRRLLTGEGSGAHKLRILANLYRAIVAAPLGTAEKGAFAQKISAMQTAFITSTRFFASIEKQVLPTAKKAFQVIDYCEEGCFIPGDNLEKAKALVRHYTTRPDFMDSYLGHIPSADGKRELLATLKERLDKLGIPLPVPQR
ncbi:hypothetical protein GCM10011497_00290 [Elstera cyanobacteriorum]|uniref:Uncharacterized protein n=2 Tax=Elstera cyanobacteriorum TaxID=2022747 RepID=A0A255XPN5_9PROT|nr:hypothetical protein CHR90_11920 [Elstera cyanobacteriorum]GFZ76691.1 hypothetical protein GCM10011497_00290 [Elstera cyanobacteriorum]